MFELLVDANTRGHWESQVLDGLRAWLESNDRAVEVRRLHAFGWSGRRAGSAELDHSAAVLRRTDDGTYAVLEMSDWDPPARLDLHAVALDPACRVVLKCQRRARGGVRSSKIRPWTYFEDNPAAYASLLPELRRPRTRRRALFFMGNAALEDRAGILAALRPTGLLSGWEKRSVGYADYLRLSTQHTIVLALTGFGDLCHREFEAFGAGVPVLRTRLENVLHEPLVPDVHYLSVETTADASPEAVADAIVRRYHEVIDDEALLDRVATEAMAWYERNVRMPASIELTARLLGLDGWR